MANVSPHEVKANDEGAEVQSSKHKTQGKLKASAKPKLRGRGRHIVPDFKL
jgi:hypothetical protein